MRLTSPLKKPFLQSSVMGLDCAREFNNFPEKLNNFFWKGENSGRNNEKPALFQGAGLKYSYVK
jgi:hypothetical protein